MDSQFEDKLNTNYVPNDEEIDVIKQWLVEPNNKLRQLDDEIEKVQAELSKLLQEQDTLNDQLKAHKDLLSAARRLPPDVLQKIFHYCLPTDHNPVMSNKGAPILLCQVCSQWRDIAMGTPRLWAAIHIAIPSDNGNTIAQNSLDNGARIQAITAWLSRSGACPLTISVFTSRFDSVTNTSVHAYLDAISPFSSRWKSLQLSLPDSVWTTFLQRYRDVDVPLLEKIHFDSTVNYPGVPGNSGTNFRRDNGILRAPNLRSITLIQYELQIFHLPLRWTQLTELNLAASVPTWQPPEGFSITEALSLLSLCPNLQLCSLQLSSQGFNPLPNGETGIPRLTLPKLRGLAITECTNIDSGAFFDHLTTPSLRRFKFRPASYSTYTPPAVTHTLPANVPKPALIALPLFFRRSQAAIEELELDAGNLLEADVLKLLSLMPDLKKLKIWTYGARSPSSPFATPPIPPPPPPLVGSFIPPAPAGVPYHWETTLFTFEDRHLKRFIPGGGRDEGNANDNNTAGPSGSGGSGVPGALNHNHDDSGSDSGSDDSDDTGDDAASQAPSQQPPGPTASSAAAQGDDASLDYYSDYLCPLLEEFQCSGAVFSDSVFLDFLRARSSLSSSSTTHDSNSANPTSSTTLSNPSSATLDLALDPIFLSLEPLPPAHLRKVRVSFTAGRLESETIKDELERIRKETGMYLEVHYTPEPASSYYRKYSPYDGLHVNSLTTANGDTPLFLYSASFN